MKSLSGKNMLAAINLNFKYPGLLYISSLSDNIALLNEKRDPKICIMNRNPIETIMNLLKGEKLRASFLSYVYFRSMKKIMLIKNK